jgi:hypothetical protein
MGRECICGAGFARGELWHCCVLHVSTLWKVLCWLMYMDRVKELSVRIL